MSNVVIFTTPDLVELRAARDLLTSQGFDIVIQPSTSNQLGAMFPTSVQTHDILVDEKDADECARILEEGFRAPRDSDA